jgi:hypothetical protein
MRIPVWAALWLAAGAISAWPASPPDKVVQMIVTVADHATGKPGVLKASDMSVINATVIDVQPIAFGQDLELFILIDDAANYQFESKLESLRRFIAGQPSSVAIGVAYIHDGALQIARMPTTDGAAIEKALRVPSGSRAANPYCALSDLIERWNKKTLRRAIILVSTGMDETATETAICTNADTTIEDAERAGVQIYGLYNPDAGYKQQTWSKVDNGVTDLAHVCYETGGEAYFTGHDPLRSLETYLGDIAEHLSHQYLVTLKFSGDMASGRRALFLSTPYPGPELMAPEGVWLPPSGK